LDFWRRCSRHDLQSRRRKGDGDPPKREGNSEISELESPVLDARNLAVAARMLGSSDDMPERQGLALDSVADMLVEKLEALEKTRERVWRLALAATDAAA
jgi:hypothetical protein